MNKECRRLHLYLLHRVRLRERRGNVLRCMYLGGTKRRRTCDCDLFLIGSMVRSRQKCCVKPFVGIGIRYHHIISLSQRRTSTTITNNISQKNINTKILDLISHNMYQVLFQECTTPVVDKYWCQSKTEEWHLQ